MKIKSILSLLLLLITSFYGFSQYAPAAGKPGSSALFKDSSIFINWAVQCTIKRGWKNIAQKDSGLATIGDGNSVIGKAGENGVVSLGDSGIAICEFNIPIKNGEGYDFAVFENTFDDRFLELAFVDISSDGFRYFRFPCHSLTDTLLQTGAFGYTEPENINNLAGKYRTGYGTPFDIADLPDYKDLDKNNIRFVKIVDVVGSINSKFASFDSANRKINDPWPTPFASSGFDLDAIGVINQKSISIIQTLAPNQFIKGPNPIKDEQNLIMTNDNGQFLKLKIYNAYGQIIHSFETTQSDINIEASELPLGLFYIELLGTGKNFMYRGIKL